MCALVTGVQTCALPILMPAAGSAYSYSYAVLGEGIAWMVGWSLILEYSLVVSTVAVGWSGYAAPLLTSVGFPDLLTRGPELGGLVNLPAIRSEEQTSELQSLMRISYDVFCLKKKTKVKPLK